jgi:hypothetical protein
VNQVELRLQFQQSTSLRLLRANNGPLVLAVLFSAFKHDHQPVIAESRLRALLETELQEAREMGSEGDKTAKQYLAEWADAEHGYVRRFHTAESDEACYELTPETERVFQWIDTLRARPHVGTESKFKYLSSTLAEIVENATSEPDYRIGRLKEEQARIQQQIDEIIATGIAPTYTPTQINERFLAVLETARQLLGDFREVERHFREATEQIVVRQTDSSATRGGIVGGTLDSQEKLRQTSQGQSFYAFWEFLILEETRRRFSELVERAYRLENLEETLRSDTILRGLQNHLRVEGAKVLASNIRLVAQLRRVLDVKQAAERREIRTVLQEIKSLCYELRELPAQIEVGEIEAEIELNSLMSRGPWEPATALNFGGVLEMNDSGDYSEMLEKFLRQHPIDFARLRKNVQECLRTRVQITLPELLEEYPVRNGIVEVLGYLVIAGSDGPHVIFDEYDWINLPETPQRVFRVPKVVYSNT